MGKMDGFRSEQNASISRLDSSAGFLGFSLVETKRRDSSRGFSQIPRLDSATQVRFLDAGLDSPELELAPWPRIAMRHARKLSCCLPGPLLSLHSAARVATSWRQRARRRTRGALACCLLGEIGTCGVVDGVAQLPPRLRRRRAPLSGWSCAPPQHACAARGVPTAACARGRAKRHG